jgi:hypothetical protein
VPRVSAPELVGEWRHRHEEDQPGRVVFARAGTPLPPSRGRRRLLLRAGGAFEGDAPGATDRPEATRGTWELASEDRLVLRHAGEREAVEAFRVLAVTADRLLLAPA